MTDAIQVSRFIAAPPRVVYGYLTESTKWSRWQGAEAEIEARPGGLFLMKMPDGATARGEFVELVPDRRVVFTWGWIDHPGVPPGSSTVEIDIASHEQGSNVTITHRGLPADEIELHTLGWNQHLPRLAAAAEGKQSDLDQAPPISDG